MDARSTFQYVLRLIVCCALLGGGRMVAQAEGTKDHQIVGKVTELRGKPIPDVIVVIGSAPSLFERETGTFVKTGEDGDFRLRVDYPGSATISCWHREFETKTETVSTDLETAITLSPGNALSGTVACAEELLERVAVSVYFPTSGYQEYARGDRSGGFRLANLPAGKCEVEVRVGSRAGDRRAVARLTAVVLPDKENRVDASFPEYNASLSGTVLDGTGGGAVAQVALQVNTGDTSYFEDARSDSGGRFAFQAVPAGKGQVVVTSGGRAGQLIDVPVERAGQVLEVVTLQAGLPFRCTFLNIPGGTDSIQVILLFGRVPQPSGPRSEVRALLDAPAAWSKSIRDKSTRAEHLAPGEYTLLAYPVDSSSPGQPVFETAELLRNAPAYLDYFTIAEGSDGATVAASFPQDGRAAHAAAQQPMHPIIGRWAYNYKGSVWTRTFTRDGRCILTEGPVTAWVNPYVILGETRVAVYIDGKQRIHTLQPNGRLDVEGAFMATKVND